MHILQRQPSKPYSDGDTKNTHTALLTHINLAQIILSVFHILTDIVNHIFKNLIFYNCTVAWLYL